MAPNRISRKNERSADGSARALHCKKLLDFRFELHENLILASPLIPGFQLQTVPSRAKSDLESCPYDSHSRQSAGCR
jgi:hypothetical protein